MRNTHCLQLALGIDRPWLVAASDFNAAKKRRDIEVDFRAGGRFCPTGNSAYCLDVAGGNRHIIGA